MLNYNYGYFINLQMQGTESTSLSSMILCYFSLRNLTVYPMNFISGSANWLQTLYHTELCPHAFTVKRNNTDPMSNCCISFLLNKSILPAIHTFSYLQDFISTDVLAFKEVSRDFNLWLNFQQMGEIFLKKFPNRRISTTIFKMGIPNLPAG